MVLRLKLRRFIFALVFSTLVQAQTSPTKAPEKSAGLTKPSTASEIALEDEIEKMRKVTAVALITSLADEARDYRDETLRVRIQARAAEALWKTNQERAITLFDRAWETASVIDKAAEQRNKEDRQRFLSGSNIGLISPLRNLRLEVLRFVARCDRELAEKFLADLEERKNEDDKDSGAINRSAWDPTEPPLAFTKRLELATLMLDSGQIDKALRLADPGLERVTKPGIIFLYKLRQTNPDVADKRFSALLSRTAVDRFADANSISLLSSYAFTPLVFATVTRNGRAYGGEAVAAPVLSNEVRAVFFRTAAQVLLKPISGSDQDNNSAGRAGTYFVIARLLPLFEKYAPEKVSELNVQLAALTEDTPENVRSDYAMRTAGFSSETPAPNDFDSELKQLRAASNSAERDRIYLRAVSSLVKTDPQRARDLVDKIEDVELNKHARAFVDFFLVRTYLEGKNAERALSIIRKGALPSIQRVWAYTQVSLLLKNSAEAIEVLNEAESDARRIDLGNQERVQALIAIATAFYAVDRVRAWEIMAETVKAAGSSDQFKGEAGRVTADLKTGSMIARLDYEAPGFDLSGIFSMLAKDDLQRAIELAKRFTTEEPRAIAIFAVAQSVLDEKQTSIGR